MISNISVKSNVILPKVHICIKHQNRAQLRKDNEEKGKKRR
jgi:hypothetical protein